jgi:hypothetical protein
MFGLKTAVSWLALLELAARAYITPATDARQRSELDQALVHVGMLLSYKRCSHL